MFATNRSADVFRTKAPKRMKYPVIGETRDADGHLWYVRQVRETKHGFDLLFGSPESRVHPLPTGLPRLIPTQSLKDFWEANKTRNDRTLYDLPAGRTTLKRVRHRWGFHVQNDVEKFWRKNIDDLRTLSVREIAEKHGLNTCVVNEARFRMIGRTARQQGWWREARVINLLLSRLTLREVSEKLGVGISHVARLRKRVQREMGGGGLIS